MVDCIENLARVKRYKQRVKQILKTIFNAEEMAEKYTLSDYKRNIEQGVFPTTAAIVIFYSKEQ